MQSIKIRPVHLRLSSSQFMVKYLFMRLFTFTGPSFRSTKLMNYMKYFIPINMK